MEPGILHGRAVGGLDAQGAVQRETVQVFWGDERHLPPEHPESNYRMANEALVSRVPMPPGNVHRIRGEEQDAGKAAASYEQTLREFFRLQGDQLPRFDLILLGMGADGHTASLFPGTPAIREQRRLVLAQWVEKLRSSRITLTPPVLSNAASVIFLVSGEEKAEALRAVIEGEYQPNRFPAQIVRPAHGRLLWLVDGPTARWLHHTPQRYLPAS